MSPDVMTDVDSTFNVFRNMNTVAVPGFCEVSVICSNLAPLSTPDLPAFGVEVWR
jgi:hypothetical protein